MTFCSANMKAVARSHPLASGKGVLTATAAAWELSPNTKQAIINTICTALEIHAQLEEEIFYPAVRSLDPSDGVIAKSVPEHDEMRRLIAELRAMAPADPRVDDTVFELMRKVMHHVADEEAVLLPAAERSLGDRLGELGARMTQRRLQLAGPRAGEIAINQVRAMPMATLIAVGGALLLGSWMLQRTAGRTAFR